MLGALPLSVPVMIVHGLSSQGGHLRGARGLQGDRAEGRRQRQGVPRDRPLGTTGRRSGRAARSARSGSTATPRSTSVAILRPFLDQYLKDGAPKADIAPVTAFETGTNVWRRLNAWPSGCAKGCAPKATPLYLSAGLKAGFEAPKAGRGVRRVRVRPREAGGDCRSHISEDRLQQEPGVAVARERSARGLGRPDVLAFVSDVLTAPVKISGEPIANLIGLDGGRRPGLGRQADRRVCRRSRRAAVDGRIPARGLFRGRYRESLETPTLLYSFALPNANHVFSAGPPHHGAGPVELVPLLRPEPARRSCRASSGRIRAKLR